MDGPNISESSPGPTGKWKLMNDDGGFYPGIAYHISEGVTGTFVKRKNLSQKAVFSKKKSSLKFGNIGT